MDEGSPFATNIGAKTILNVEMDHVDFRNAHELKSQITRLVERGDKDVVLNLGHVNFMDSTGLSVLLTGKRLTEQAGGTFGICNLQSAVHKLLLVTNLYKAIAVYTNNKDVTHS